MYINSSDIEMSLSNKSNKMNEYKNTRTDKIILVTLLTILVGSIGYIIYYNTIELKAVNDVYVQEAIEFNKMCQQEGINCVYELDFWYE